MSWESFLGFLLDLCKTWGLRLLAALIVLIVGWRLVRFLQKRLRTSKRIAKLEDTLQSFLSSCVSIVSYVVLFLTVAMILGVPATSFITILASGGVAIGLALQGALSNFAGGLMLLLFKPFSVGDYIETADESGTVAEISVIYTILLTPDNKRITIPNGTLLNSTITNYSSEATRRVDLAFSVAYDSSSEEVMRVLSDVVTAHPLVLRDPAPFVRLTACGDSALTYTVRAWCQTADYWTVHLDLLERGKAALDKAGIEIPFPQMDVHMKK